MAAYMCKGTIVRNKDGYEGRVVTVDNERNIALVRRDKAFSIEHLNDLKVVSYKEVD